MNSSLKIAWVGLALLSLLIGGCVGMPKVLGAPQVLIQELLQHDGKVRARVLLHNFSNVEMNFSELNYELRFSSAAAAQARESMDLLVPASSPESLEVTLALSPQAQKILNSGSRFDYQISGTITSSKPSREFRFNYQGKLGPTPGKAGSWR